MIEHSPAPSSDKNSPLARYQKQLQQEGFLSDERQLSAVKQLDELYQQLQNKTGFLIKKDTPQGLYLWGQVGIGKTFLMDLFYESLPHRKKLRLHFQQFMAKVHQELNKVSGKKDPLDRVAKKIFKECHILCLDELFITEIGDGMIIYRLLRSLFERGLVLVTTSNFAVDQLYKDDLQPRIFDPAVDLLLAHTKHIHLDSKQDYRLQQANPKQTYFLTENENFTALFKTLNNNKPSQTRPLHVCNRPIEVVRRSNDIAWFKFEALCCGPRSQLDYLELAKRYNTILISGIPVLGGNPQNQIKARGTEDGSGGITPTSERKVFYAQEDNAARRFISLIDALYDQNINLYLSAATPLSGLYAGSTLNFEFTRTQSRLIEMQSLEYLENSSGRIPL